MLGIEAMIHVIKDQGALGVRDGLLDSLHLLRDLKAGLPRLDHVNNGTKMPIGALQPCDEGGMGCVDMGLCHKRTLSSHRG